MQLRISAIAILATTTKIDVSPYCGTSERMDGNEGAVTTDWTSVQLNTFSMTCELLEPLDREAINKAVSAASCEAAGVSSIVVPVAATVSIQSKTKAFVNPR